MRYLALLLAVLVTCAQAIPAQGRNGAGMDGGVVHRPLVVLVSIDGLRPGYVTHAESLGLRVPHLRRLMREGEWSSGVRGVVPTVTYPSHTTLITGASPERHGIYGNTTFDPEQKNQLGWYWYASDIRVPTLWHAARDRGLVTANVHWPVSVGAPVTFNLPQIWRTGTPDDRKLLRALATDGLVDQMEAALGPYADGIDESIEGDERRARFAAWLIERHAPSLVTAYFTALDHEQHRKGPLDSRSESTMAVLERIDALVGLLWEAARKVQGDSVTIAVVSDHGFAPTTTEINLIPMLAREGLISVDSGGRITAWRAGVWTNGASIALVPRDRADTATASQLRAIAKRIADDASFGAQQVLAGPEVARLRGFPNAEVVVLLRPGFTSGSKTSGPVARPASVQGMHGHAPELPIMHASFFMAGRGAARGRALGEIDMRAIAPRLGALLGLTLSGAELP